jgi:predicted porin
MALGVAPDSPFATLPLFGANSLVSSDFSASYMTAFNGSEVGFFAGYSGGASLFTAAPTPGWNFGASVGYAGFYVQAGISDNSGGQQRLNGDLKSDPKQGWLAGFGYKTGGLNLRLSYLAAQSLTANESDTRTWMIGGIYQISSRVRLNADAFTSPRAPAVSNPAAATNVAAPQGTGARVGVQLRF